MPERTVSAPRPSPAGDVNYEQSWGVGYASHRRPDPRIEALIHSHLGNARTILNVGAGAGSYEPLDRHVIAIEPAAAMRAQRPRHLAPAIDAVADSLPLDDNSVDAAMAILTVHQWPDVERGIRELRRVTRGPIVVMTFDGDDLHRFWLADYAPDLISVEARRYPPIARLATLLGNAEVHTVLIPVDCIDGFTEAYYARPERLLDDGVRRSQSAWGFVSPEAQASFVRRLRTDLETGAWDGKYGSWRTKPVFLGSLRLIVGQPA